MEFVNNLLNLERNGEKVVTVLLASGILLQGLCVVSQFSLSP